MPARTAVVATVFTCVTGATKVAGETLILRAIFAAEGKTKPPLIISASKSDRSCMMKKQEEEKRKPVKPAFRHPRIYTTCRGLKPKAKPE
jgi:hypothetical protein